jgi:hypothetical protein
MRCPIAAALSCAVICGVVAGCAQDAAAPPALPPTGAAYRALDDGGRLAAATACRDRAAAAARGVAADELAKADPRALRGELDAALSARAARRRPMRELCAQRLPFVTPGLRVTFFGAPKSGDAYTYQTRSDKPLTIRGTVAPGAAGAYVVARREFGHAHAFRTRIGADGSFVLPTVRLRRQANNSFDIAFQAPPHAPQAAHFSAICVDCLASGSS